MNYNALMALSTSTSVDCLQSIDRELEKRNIVPEVSRQELDALKSGVRRTIEKLLLSRERIERLKSTDNQREAYGPERWEREFVLLRDVQEHQFSASEGEELQRRIWNALPDSRFKRFQLLFTRREDLIVPPFEIDRKGKVSFPGTSDFDSLSLAPCLVSPDRISEDLAQDLRLCTFTEEDRHHPVERLERKHEAIPALKKLWESITPLQKNARRWFQASPPTEKIDELYPNVPGPHPDILGTVLYVRERVPSDEDPIPLVAQHFDSVYDASRKPIHQYENYGRELSTLVLLEEDVRLLNQQLNTDWSEKRNRKHLKRKCEQVMQECIDRLEQCENRFKMQACNLAGEARALQDSLGRENLAAKMAQLVAIINRFLKRYGEMKLKAGCNEQDRLSLQEHIAREEHILASFLRSVRSSADSLGQKHIALFEEGKKKQSDRSLDSQAKGLLKRMGIEASPLQRITLQPLRFYAHHLADGFNDLQMACLAGDRGWAEHSLIHLHVLGKFQLVRGNLERLKAKLIVEDSLPRSRDRVEGMLQALEKYYGELQIFPSNVVEEYRAPFEQLHNEIHKVIDFLGRIESTELNTDIRRELKRKLDAIDVEKLAQVLT